MAIASPSAGAVMLMLTAWMAVMRRNVTVVVRNTHIAKHITLKKWMHLAADVMCRLFLLFPFTIVFQWVDTAPWMSFSATTLFVNPLDGCVTARTTVAITPMKIQKSVVRITVYTCRQ